MKRAKLKGIPPYVPCSTCLSGWVERDDGSVVRCGCWRAWMFKVIGLAAERTSERERTR